MSHTPKNSLMQQQAFCPLVKVPQPDGSLLIKPGKPLLLGDEIGTAEFAKLCNLSRSYVEELCNSGHIKCRRASPKAKSKFLIQRSEVERYRKLDLE